MYRIYLGVEEGPDDRSQFTNEIKKDGKLINVAGRVANVCARAATLSEALEKAYRAAPKVRFQGARYRTDIGYRALEQRAEASRALQAQAAEAKKRGHRAAPARTATAPRGPSVGPLGTS